MELRRELDVVAFLIALGALGVAALGFVVQRNGAAAVMCAICLAGLIAGRIAGVSGAALLPVAIGLTVILWMVWIDPPASPRRTSAIAHAGGGALAGWALALTLRRRLALQIWPFVAAACVIALTGVWEVGEWLGDRALDTALIPSRRDSAEDVFFGTCGGIVAIVLVGLLRRRPETPGSADSVEP